MIKFSSGDASDAMHMVFPDSVKTGSAFDGAFGYVNLDSGWVLATRGIEMLMSRVIALGGKVMGGKAVTGLIRPPDSGGRTSGVMLADGSSISARLVVIASGSWTASTFRRDLQLDHDDKQRQFLSNRVRNHISTRPKTEMFECSNALIIILPQVQTEYCDDST